LFTSYGTGFWHR